MDWKQATSLFIVVFMIINAALGFIYYEKVERAKIVDEMKSEPVNFESEGIDIPELPDTNNIKMSIVAGKSAGFTKNEKDLNKTSEELGTKINVKIPEKIYIENYEPSNISKNKKLKKLLSIFVKNGDHYILSGIDKKNRKLYYDQLFENHPILNNDKAQLILYLNEDNKIYQYSQTYLEDLREGLGKNNEKKQVRPAREAIEALYYNTDLKKGDKVSSVRLGYYSIVREVRGQVLKPTWQIAIVKPDETVEIYYVDAVSPEQTILR